MVGVVDGMSYLDGIPQPSISGIQFDLSMVLRVEMAEQDENKISKIQKKQIVTNQI